MLLSPDPVAQGSKLLHPLFCISRPKKPPECHLRFLCKDLSTLLAGKWRRLEIVLLGPIPLYQNLDCWSVNILDCRTLSVIKYIAKYQKKPLLSSFKLETSWGVYIFIDHEGSCTDGDPFSLVP